MVGVDWVEEEVLKAVPDAVVEVIDLHGSGDHFHVRIISEILRGRSPSSTTKAGLGRHEAAHSSPRSRA
jgi:acid stress-induced BolA-like protein IbaG/YrbA